MEREETAVIIIPSDSRLLLEHLAIRAFSALYVPLLMHYLGECTHVSNTLRTDRQLIEACLAGETQAFAILVDRYRYPVFGLCVGYTKDFDAAEDAAQEAFIASYLGLGTLHEPEGFGPWLKRIAENECRMWLRRQRRQVPLGPEIS